MYKKDPDELDEFVVGDLLAARAKSHRSACFLEFRDSSFTFGEVDEQVDQVVCGLTAAGVCPGDHVAVMLPNRPEMVFAMFALARLGAVAVPVNTAHRGEVLRQVVGGAHCTTLIIDDAYVSRLVPVAEQLPYLRRVVVAGARPGAPGEEATRVAKIPAFDWASLLVHGTEPATRRVTFADLLAIMYTSGSTGPAKGAMVPHALALACAQDVRGFVNPQGKKLYCPLPLFHAAALWDGVFSALLGGSAIAIVERFSASRFWDDVRRFEAKVALSVFAMLPILLNRPPSPSDRDHPLEVFYTGKSALDSAFSRRFGVRSVEAYTSTEGGVPLASPFGRWREGSCGKANDKRFDVAVVDEWDREVPIGSAGELVLRPKQPYVITTGYYERFDATARAFRNMWFHTGDRVRQDADGYFYFVDRMADGIRRRGENISAFDIELEVNTHPGVEECAVIAVPAEVGEDDVKLVVVTRPPAKLTHDEVIDFCRVKLPGFMVPRYVEFVPELPRTPTDKIAKHELRAAGDRGLTSQTWDRERRAFVPLAAELAREPA